MSGDRTEIGFFPVSACRLEYLQAGLMKRKAEPAAAATRAKSKRRAAAVDDSSSSGAASGGGSGGGAASAAAADARPATRREPEMSDVERGATMLHALQAYVEECGGTRDAMRGWNVTVEPRPAGHQQPHDVYYFNPAKKRFRSRAEVCAPCACARAPDCRVERARTMGEEPSLRVESFEQIVRTNRR